MDGFGSLLGGPWAALGLLLGGLGRLLNRSWTTLGAFRTLLKGSWRHLGCIFAVMDGSGLDFGGFGDVPAWILMAFGVILTCVRTS